MIQSMSYGFTNVITHQMTIDNRSKTAVVKNIVDKMIFKNNPDLGRANFFAQGYRDGTLE